MTPLLASIKKVVRPAVMHTRRKELTIEHRVPVEIFQMFMDPLTPTDAKEVKRDEATGDLLPTETTGSLRKWHYAIRKGSVSDRLFQLESLDPAPPLPRKPAPETAEIGTEDVYEVESILEKRVRGKSGKFHEYKVKWLGWDDHPQSTTWEKPSNIDPSLIAEFEGKPAPKKRRVAAANLPKRGAGCARAHLSAADQRRGGVPTCISMVCGNVLVDYSESIDQSKMGTLKLTFYVLTLDKNGHIVWPTTFEKPTQAYLRNQARTLLRRMMDDPLNPVDESMAPALTGVGSSSVWQAAPKRKLVAVE